MTTFSSDITSITTDTTTTTAATTARELTLLWSWFADDIGTHATSVCPAMDRSADSQAAWQATNEVFSAQTCGLCPSLFQSSHSGAFNNRHRLRHGPRSKQHQVLPDRHGLRSKRHQVLPDKR
jgi:hypothetical protein